MTSSILVRRFMGMLNDRAFDTMNDILHDEVVLHYPGVRAIQGRSQAIILLRQILSLFTQLKFEIVDIIEQREKICVLWENEGERRGGVSYHNQGATIFHVRDGRISVINDYFKSSTSV